MCIRDSFPFNDNLFKAQFGLKRRGLAVECLSDANRRLPVFSPQRGADSFPVCGQNQIEDRQIPGVTGATKQAVECRVDEQEAILIGQSQRCLLYTSRCV